MIGQRELVAQIDRQLEIGKFPQFVIFAGARGSGKKTLIREIVSKAHYIYTEFPTTVDGVRELISFINSGVEDIACVVPNIDTLSQAGCEAILKIAEEPPIGTILMATCEDIENVPTTIRSRAVVYLMEEYSEDDMIDFCDQRGYPINEFVLSVCDTLGDIELMQKYEVESFRKFIDLVINNIASVSGSNVFKIADRIALKSEDDNKYDLSLFLKAFSSVCVDYMLNKDPDNCLKFSNAVAITGNVIAEARVKGINKQMLFDKWVLDIRGAWL